MSPIRVIAGEAKGRKLKMVPGDSTRPVTDRVKEALFNILGGLVIDSKLLDLFAGTGSVGIEGLSRGAQRAVFVDSNAAAIQTINVNLEATGFSGQARVVKSDAFDFIKRPAESHFDLVYVAPPQYKGIWHRALQALDRTPTCLSVDAWVIVQIDPVEWEEIALKNLQLFDRRKYGSTELLFFEYSQSGNPPE